MGWPLKRCEIMTAQDQDLRIHPSFFFTAKVMKKRMFEGLNKGGDY